MKGTTISSFLHPTFLWDCAWVIFLFIPFPIIEHPISFPNFPLQVVLSVMYIKIFLNFNGHFNQQIVPRLFCVHQTKYSSWNVFQLVSFLFLGYWRYMVLVVSYTYLVFFFIISFRNRYVEKGMKVIFFKLYVVYLAPSLLSRIALILLVIRFSLDSSWILFMFSSSKYFFNFVWCSYYH